MRRIAVEMRPDWERKVRVCGLAWRAGEQPGWAECACYEFDAREIEILENATVEIERMALAAVRHVVENRLYAQLAVPETAIPLVESSWEAGAQSLCTRFDLAWDSVHPPKLLECGAEFPSSLVEAAVVQREWLGEVYPGRGQSNSLHPKLVAAWRGFASRLPRGRVDFCLLDEPEGRTIGTFLAETARQAGLTASIFPIQEIGWNGLTFEGPDGRPLDAVCKLYPWDSMAREEFGRHIRGAPTVWIEPPWKMLLANRGILPVLWKLFPRHPNLLEASFDTPGLLMSWVKKPLVGREGDGITLHQPGKDIETAGAGRQAVIYQDLAPVRAFDGAYPVIGSWVVGGPEGAAPAGVGVRESDLPVSTRASCFVPHVLA